MNRKKKGYTLIELMIVIVILGILMSILLPHLVMGKYQAQLTACEYNERNIATALENYKTDNEQYPDVTNFGALFTGSGGNPPYMQPRPKCPSNMSDYGYVENQSIGSFTVYCQGIHWKVVRQVTNGFPQYANARGLMLEP